MTADEYCTRLAAMSDTEFAEFKGSWGGDGVNREWYVQNFLQQPEHEGRLCDS